MSRKYGIKIGGKHYDVTVNGVKGGIADIEVNGKSYQVELDPEQESAPSPIQVPVVSRPEKPSLATLSKGHNYSTGLAVQAPLPGVILSINVTVGQQVRRGQKVAVLEAMKMENDIIAERDGTVTAISVHRGDSVLEGETLMSIG